MDNRGNRIIISDTDSAINTPAIGAAHVVNSYAAKAPDELSLEVTLSVIVMLIWHFILRSTFLLKGSPYSIIERGVLELIPVLGSQPAVTSHKPSGRLPLLSARLAITFLARRPVPVLLLGEQRHNGCEQFA